MFPLEVAGLVKVYRAGKDAAHAVDNVTFRVRCGEIFAFLGPNGAGKTTTIKMIAGLVRPTAGTVLVGGRDPHRDRRAVLQLGAVLEGSRNVYWHLTPEENLVYFGALRGLSPREARHRGSALLGRFGLTGKRAEPVRTLSRGMQQKVAIATALLHEPQLLLLDEPTLGLDVHSAVDVKRLIRERAEAGTAVVLTTHQLDLAEELADTLGIIRRGQLVVDGRMRQVLDDYSAASYRIRFEGIPTHVQRRALAEVADEITDGEIAVARVPERLYAVLEILKPLEIVSVTRDQKALADVFTELTLETAGV